MNVDDRAALDVLDLRLRTLLPEEYQDSYEDVQPAPMRSAGLKFDADGKVAWDEIWGSFCDLAMAGGPPHKGALLEPGTPDAIAASPERHAVVTDEIRRGIEMVTELPTGLSPAAGWVRVTCINDTMARWLLRAIVMENVAVQRDFHMLDLPAAPHFRLEKEIKNVVTVIAKTCHYWTGHMWLPQRRRIAALLSAMQEEGPVVAPALATDGVPDGHERSFAALAAAIDRDTGLAASSHRYVGWLGMECRSVAAAVWMMRLLVAANVLTRREGTVLFVPVNPSLDPDGQVIARAVARVHRFAAAAGVL